MRPLAHLRLRRPSGSKPLPARPFAGLSDRMLRDIGLTPRAGTRLDGIEPWLWRE